MPVPAKVGGIIRNHYEVKGLWWDRSLAARTDVVLPGLVGLDGCDGYVEKRAHAMTAAVATTARTTMTMSSTERS